MVGLTIQLGFKLFTHIPNRSHVQKFFVGMYVGIVGQRWLPGLKKNPLYLSLRVKRRHAIKWDFCEKHEKEGSSKIILPGQLFEL